MSSSARKFRLAAARPTVARASSGILSMHELAIDSTNAVVAGLETDFWSRARPPSLPNARSLTGTEFDRASAAADSILRRIMYDRGEGTAPDPFEPFNPVKTNLRYDVARGAASLVVARASHGAASLTERDTTIGPVPERMREIATYLAVTAVAATIQANHLRGPTTGLLHGIDGVVDATVRAVLRMMPADQVPLKARPSTSSPSSPSLSQDTAWADASATYRLLGLAKSIDPNETDVAVIGVAKLLGVVRRIEQVGLAQLNVGPRVLPSYSADLPPYPGPFFAAPSSSSSSSSSSVPRSKSAFGSDVPASSDWPPLAVPRSRSPPSRSPSAPKSKPSATNGGRDERAQPRKKKKSTPPPPPPPPL
jgi:hypothetical protein